MNKDIQKPLTVAVEEFKKNIEATVNNSGLPPFVIWLIFDRYLNEIASASQKQYEKERAEYENALSKTGESN